MDAQAQKYALAFLRLFGVKGGCGTRIYVPDKALKGSDRIKNLVSQLDGPLSSGSETYGNLAPVDDSHIKYVQSYEFDCSTGGINPLLGLTTFGIIIAATYILFTQVTGRRRRRDLGSNAISSFESQGLEDFEGKIEKIAGGVDKDENSWLNKLYKQYHGESLAETLEGDTLAEENEDEMALSNDEHESVENRAFRKKRSDEEVVRKEEEDIEAIFNSVESSCSTKFWRCVSNVIEGGLHYTEMPGGLTGAMKKHLMKVVFAGGISNMWDSLMTVPEARKFQKCMAKQTECTEYEILQKALNSEKALPQRVLVVPETVKVEEEPEK